MATAKAYLAKHIFTGEWLHEHAAIVSEGMITNVLPAAALDPQMEAVHFNRQILAPAFIDSQIYGAYDKLFSVYPDTNSLALLNQYSNSGGAAFVCQLLSTCPKYFSNVLMPSDHIGKRR